MGRLFLPPRTALPPAPTLPPTPPQPAPGSAVLGGSSSPRPGDAVLGGGGRAPAPEIPPPPPPPSTLPPPGNVSPPKEEPSQSSVKPSDIPKLQDYLGNDPDLRKIAGLPPDSPSPPPGEKKEKPNSPNYPNEYGLANGQYRILGRFVQKITYYLSYDKSSSISINQYFWALESNARLLVGRFFGAIAGKKSAGIYIDIVAGTVRLFYRYKNDNQKEEDPELTGFLFLSGFDNSEDEAFLRRRIPEKLSIYGSEVEITEVAFKVERLDLINSVAAPPVAPPTEPEIAPPPEEPDEEEPPPPETNPNIPKPQIPPPPGWFPDIPWFSPPEPPPELPQEEPPEEEKPPEKPATPPDAPPKEKSPDAPPQEKSPDAPPQEKSPDAPPQEKSPDTPPDSPPQEKSPDAPPQEKSPDTPPDSPPQEKSPDAPPQEKSPDTPPQEKSPDTPPQEKSPDTPPQEKSPDTPPDSPPQEKSPDTPPQEKSPDAPPDSPPQENPPDAPPDSPPQENPPDAPPDSPPQENPPDAPPKEAPPEPPPKETPPTSPPGLKENPHGPVDPAKPPAEIPTPTVPATPPQAPPEMPVTPPPPPSDPPAIAPPPAIPPIPPGISAPPQSPPETGGGTDTDTTPNTGGGTGDDPCAGNACQTSIKSGVKNNGEKLNDLSDLLNKVLTAINTLISFIESLGIGRILARIEDLFSRIDQLEKNVMERLNKLSKWLHLDKVLAVLTFITVLHNAYFLSSSLTQTLFYALSNSLAFFNVKSEDDQFLDFNSIVGKAIDEIAKETLGVSTWEGMKHEWKALNRIYQAASNIIFTFQSIAFNILSALEIVGQGVALIGNAVKRAHVVMQSAYGWMNPSPNFHNRFFTNLQTAQEFASGIAPVAQSAVAVKDAINGLKAQEKELKDALKDADPSSKPQVEANKVKEKEAVSNSKSAGNPVKEEDIFPSL